MSGFDFEEIVRLWQHEPTEEERRIFQSLARRASRTARLAERAEIGIAVLLAVALAIAALLEPAPATLIIGALAIAAVIWSSWKRHLLHRIALVIDTAGRDQMLGSALESTAASLRRSTIGLVLLLPSLMLGALLKHSYTQGGTLRNFGEGTWDNIRSSAVALALLAVLVLSLVFIARSNLRLRSELRRIEQLRREYLSEEKLDGNGSA